jgi:hypothetical protein
MNFLKILKAKDAKLSIKGYVRLQIHRADGTLREDTGFMKNTITNAALAALSGLVGNTGSQVAFTYLAVGTDNTAAAATQTALIAEITDSGLERAAATVSRVTTTQTNDTLQLLKAWTASGSKTVEEVGAFNDASAGVMLGRKVTGSKALTSGETLTVTYKFVFAGA